MPCLRPVMLSAVLLSACGNDSPSGPNAGQGGLVVSGNGGSTGPGMSGGMPSEGGVPSSGGMAMSGGVAGSTGTAPNGGAMTSGGTAATGGSITNGGSLGAGGSSAGGANAGAPANGGTLASGGVGGTTTLGGAMPTAGATQAGSAGTAGAGGARPDGRFACPAGPFPTPSVESTKSVCTTFDFNHTFNEGPTWIASQKAFFFTNFVVRSAEQGDIIKYTPGGNCEVFIRDVGCNGLGVSHDGNLLAACHKSRSVIRFDIDTKEPTTLASMYMGELLDTPNDLIMHGNGSIYFTNPTYELDGRPGGVGQAVFRIDPAGSLSLIARTACNGIGLSPDEKKLYVLQAGVWDLDAQGVPSNRMNLFTSGDGMAVDCAGNLYASGTIFSPEGERLGQYGSGTNLAFGGEDGKTVLLVGGGTTVRELRLNVPGFP